MPTDLKRRSVFRHPFFGGRVFTAFTVTIIVVLATTALILCEARIDTDLSDEAQASVLLSEGQ